VADVVVADMVCGRYGTDPQRSIDTMTPNKLAVYFVADMVLADMVVVADMVCGRYGTDPAVTAAPCKL